MIAFQIPVSDDLNGPSRIEYVVKRDQINQTISKVSDILINAGLKLDNSGSIKGSYFPRSYKINKKAHSKNIPTGVKFLFNPQAEF